MGDVDINKFPTVHIGSANGIEPLRIGQIAPAAVHIKELNHIDPISVESLRIDHVRNIDPVRVERFDVTHLPTVNLSVGRVPAVDVNLRKMPPIAVSLQQDFCLSSAYTVHTRLLGLEILRLEVHGVTTATPRDRARREQSRAHERSFPEMATAGNPGILTRRVETHVTVTTPSSACCPPGALPSRGLHAGVPRFSYPASSGGTVAGSGGVSSGEDG